MCGVSTTRALGLHLQGLELLGCRHYLQVGGGKGPKPGSKEAYTQRLGSIFCTVHSTKRLLASTSVRFTEVLQTLHSLEDTSLGGPPLSTFVDSNTKTAVAGQAEEVMVAASLWKSNPHWSADEGGWQEDDVQLDEQLTADTELEGQGEEREQSAAGGPTLGRDCTPPLSLSGRVQLSTALADSMVGRVVLVPGRFWADIPKDTRDTIYRGYLSFVFPMETPGEDRFQGEICLQAYFSSDGVEQTLTVQEALGFLAPYSAMCLSELRLVPPPLLLCELVARQSAEELCGVGAELASHLYGLLHPSGDGPTEATLGGTSVAKAPPSLPSSVCSETQLDDLARQCDALLLGEGRSRLLLCHAVAGSDVQPPLGTSILIKRDLVQNVLQRMQAEQPLVHLISVSQAKSGGSPSFVQFAVLGNVAPAAPGLTRPVIDEYHLFTFRMHRGCYQVACTCRDHSYKHRWYRPAHQYQDCTELALLRCMSRSDDGSVAMQVLRQCLSRAGASRVGSDESSAGGAIPCPGSPVSSEEDVKLACVRRKSALWACFAHPVPEDFLNELTIPTDSGVGSLFALAVHLDATGYRMRWHDAAVTAPFPHLSVGDVRRVTAQLGVDIAYGQQGDPRPRFVQWMRSFAGGSVPFQPPWAPVLGVPRCTIY